MSDGRENLRPFDTRTEEEQREIRVKGGKASGKARRKKKELKQLLELALSQPDKETGLDNYTLLTAALLKEGLKGNVKAYEVIRDTIGQKPAEKAGTGLNGDINININVED